MRKLLIFNFHFELIKPRPKIVRPFRQPAFFLFGGKKDGRVKNEKASKHTRYKTIARKPEEVFWVAKALFGYFLGQQKVTKPSLEEALLRYHRSKVFLSNWNVYQGKR